VNIAYPFHLDSRGRTASASDNDHILQMIEQLIFTEPGERVNLPDFGSGMMQLIFAPNSPELAATVQFTMQAALQQWLGDLIDIQNLDVQSVDSTLTVSLTYLVKLTNQLQTATLSRTV
jgi:phage baseplate assembly protein W